MWKGRCCHRLFRRARGAPSGPAAPAPDGPLSQAIRGEAFDRHLLGLKLQAIEDLVSMPDIFMDTSYAIAMHFNLSTSQVGFPALRAPATALGALGWDRTAPARAGRRLHRIEPGSRTWPDLVVV